MSKKNKKLLFIIAIILIISASFVVSRFGLVSADSGSTVNSSEKTGGLYKSSNETEAEPTIQPIKNESVAWALAKLIGALIIVTVGIYGFIYLLRRMMGQRFSGNRGNNLLEVLETTYIGQKKSISLIRFSDRAVLVGVTDTGISALAELDVDKTNKILAEIKSHENQSAGFRSIFNEARSKLVNLNVKGGKSFGKMKSADRPQTA